MRPPNPKHSTGKPLQLIQGFSCDGVGYTITEHGNIRLHGKRGGVQRVDFIQPYELADMIWEWMGRKKEDK